MPHVGHEFRARDTHCTARWLSAYWLTYIRHDKAGGFVPVQPDGPAASRHVLSDAQVADVALSEMPELTRHLRSSTAIVSVLQRLNATDPQADVDGLHAVADRELASLVDSQPNHPACAALAQFVDEFPDLRPPLLTKAATLALLSDCSY